jgi:hypothetical protein
MAPPSYGRIRSPDTRRLMLEAGRGVAPDKPMTPVAEAYLPVPPMIWSAAENEIHFMSGQSLQQDSLANASGWRLVKDGPYTRSAAPTPPGLPGTAAPASLPR